MGLYGSFSRNTGLRGLGAFGQGDSATLYAGQQLTPNTSIKSDNGVFTFGMGGDGNLWVVDNVRNVVLLNFNIANRGAVKAIMQGDGNFVVYNASNGAIWNSGAKGAGAYLTMQDDGNLVIYQDGIPKWTGRSNQNPTLVASEAHTVLIRSITPITTANQAQWLQLKNSGQLSSSELATYAAFAQREATIFFSGPITFVSPGTPPPTQAQQDAALAKINSLIDNTASSSSEGSILTNWINQLYSTGKQWDAPELTFRSIDYGFTATSNFEDQKTGARNDSSVGTLNPHWTDQSKVVYNIQLDRYVKAVKAIPNIFTAYTAQNRKMMLQPLLYCYAYFQTRAINFCPFRDTGHSDRHNWYTALPNLDFSMATVSRIIDLSNYLQAPNMAKIFTQVKTAMGYDWNFSNTGGNYPNEGGIRKLIDETYRAQSNAAAKNVNIGYQIGEIFNQVGTEFWHGIVMPTIGLTLFFIAVTGFMGLTMTADLFGFHFTQQMFNFIGGLTSGMPFIGKYVAMWIEKFGNAMEAVPEYIRALGPKILSKADMQNIEYDKISSLKDNELINFSKNGNLLGVIKNDWNDDHGKVLQEQLTNNINSRKGASNIWANFAALDKKQLQGA